MVTPKTVSHGNSRKHILNFSVQTQVTFDQQFHSQA